MHKDQIVKLVNHEIKNIKYILLCDKYYIIEIERIRESLSIKRLIILLDVESITHKLVA